MKKEYGSHTISVGPAEHASLSLGDGNNTHKQNNIDTQEENAAYKTESLSNGTEDKIRSLLRHKIIACLGSF